jgi:hypothetical protein
VAAGLSLKDYLEGREAQHNELLMRVYGGKNAMRLDDDTTYLDSEVSGCVEQVGVAAGLFLLV